MKSTSSFPLRLLELEHWLCGRKPVWWCAHMGPSFWNTTGCPTLKRENLNDGQMVSRTAGCLRTLPYFWVLLNSSNLNLTSSLQLIKKILCWKLPSLFRHWLPLKACLSNSWLELSRSVGFILSSHGRWIFCIWPQWQKYSSKYLVIQSFICIVLFSAMVDPMQIPETLGTG